MLARRAAPTPRRPSWAGCGCRYPLPVSRRSAERPATGDEKPAARPTSRFTSEKLGALDARCDSETAGQKETDSDEQEQLIAESKVSGLEIT